MQTELDTGRTRFLKSLKFDDRLSIEVEEGFVSDTKEIREIGGVKFEDLREIAPRSGGRCYRIRFDRAVAWQVVDESYTSFDKSEERDDKGFMQVLSKSAYLSYVEARHGWYPQIPGPAKHYRLWTENEVIDVVTTGACAIELVLAT